MGEDEFRKLFARVDHILPVALHDGDKGLIVGLSGDNAVLHRSERVIPLANLIEVAGVAFEITGADENTRSITTDEGDERC